jgi:hypothetical protein
MNAKYQYPCYRCGKKRIITKIWKEGTGVNEVETTESICSDPECQKKSEKEMRNQKQRTKMLADKKEARQQERIRLRHENSVHVHSAQ